MRLGEKAKNIKKKFSHIRKKLLNWSTKYRL